jgi:cell division protein FtsW
MTASRIEVHTMPTKDRTRPHAAPISAGAAAPVTSLVERRNRTRAAERAAREGDDGRPRAARRSRAAPPGRRSSAFVALLGLILVLGLVGLAMVLSASSVVDLTSTGSLWSSFLKQLQWFALGTVAMVLTMRRDYRRWRDHCGWALIGVLGLLVLVVIPGVGTVGGGATRWLGRGPFTVQPSEFAKLALIVFWADLLTRRARWIDHARLTVLPVLITFTAAGVLIMKQPNLGTTMVIFAVMLVMLFVGGAGLRWLTAIVGAGAFAAAAVVARSRWRMDRIAVLADPCRDRLDTGLQTCQALAAAADGGVMGLGLGAGRAKWSYLPEADNDFIFAIIAEEAGLIGALLVIALFVALGVIGTRVALRAPDRFGMLLAAGITAWFLVQAFLNVGQAVGKLPVVGVPLPFVSSGGSSLIVSMVAAGMLLNVARQTR